ncbi:GspH/FimT family pseudopilin [Marinobacter sp. NFXS9]|uniref:GspH/FimT family pseudopilin n=1 Tax=Marinobacter sp. NFXS9 TaxID=2818433 RepID=UPI0032DF4659
MPKQAAFTLIELLVAIAIMVILVTVAVPSFQSVIASNQLLEARDSMLSAIQYTKGEAVARNQPVSVCPSTDGSTCGGSGDWADGWIVVTDTNETGAVGIGTILRVFDGPDASAVSLQHNGGGGALSFIRFLPNGLAQNMAPPSRYFGFCDPDGDVQPYSLIVAVTTGQVRTGTAAEANCP